MVRRNGYWKKHTTKELQALLLMLDDQGWRIKNPPTYYRAFCPCPEKHQTGIHLTPSNPHYAKDMLRYLERATCFVYPGRK
jgi:hypothetical protein